jgi:hypothetical protein
MNLDNYYLNLEKVGLLTNKEDRNRIHDMYRDMLYSYEENRLIIAKSFFNSLLRNGYLNDIRNEKIDLILDGDKSINS